VAGAGRQPYGAEAPAAAGGSPEMLDEEVKIHWWRSKKRLNWLLHCLRSTLLSTTTFNCASIVCSRARVQRVGRDDFFPIVMCFSLLIDFAGDWPCLLVRYACMHFINYVGVVRNFLNFPGFL
jgi:hypothetical protein